MRLSVRFSFGDEPSANDACMVSAMKGNRSWRAVFRAPLHAGHYRALAGMVVCYPQFLQCLYRFLSGGGRYPYRCRVRTPLGEVNPLLRTSHDLSTVNEIFCRRDYEATAELRVAVDVGANIGIASLYFLTRNGSARVYAFEPNPANIPQLRENLTGYEDRVSLQQVALHVCDGAVAFRVEPTGRYGYITGAASGDTITVRCREINEALREVIAREGEIDVLKIDTEGTERELVEALHGDVLAAIATIYYETTSPQPCHLDRYRHSYSTQTNRLQRLHS